jgi:hypothetical protein
MMGTKKLSEIRAELIEGFTEAGITVEWFDREIRRFQKKKAGPTAIESLHFMRSLLTEAASNEKKRPKRNKSVSAGTSRQG